VEDIERCEENSEQSVIEQPVELCDLQPQKHCSQEKVSVPRLIPERKCRNVEKEICNTQMINPHDIKQPVFIKYCTRPEKLTKASYLPPPPANRYSSSPAQANYNSNLQPSRQSTFTPIPPSSNRIAKQQFRNSPTIFAGPPPPPITIRSKREPEPFESQRDPITTSSVQPSPATQIRRQGRASWEDEKEDKEITNNHINPFNNRRSDDGNEIRRSARSLSYWNSLFDDHPWIPILKTHRKRFLNRRY